MGATELSHTNTTPSPHPAQSPHYCCVVGVHSIRTVNKCAYFRPFQLLARIRIRKTCGKHAGASICIHSPQTFPRTSCSQRCTVVGYNVHMICASLHDLNFAFARLEILMFDFPSHRFIKLCMALSNMASGEATLYHSSNQSA